MPRPANLEKAKTRPASDPRAPRMALATIPDAEEVTQSRMPRVAHASPSPLPPPLPKRLSHSGMVPKAPRMAMAIPFSLEVTLIDARLSIDLVAVDRMLAEVTYDPSMAARTMRARVQELGEIAETMTRIHALSVHDEVAALFGPTTPVSRYLRSVQDSCAAIVRASQQLAIGLRSGPASWPALEHQIDGACALYHPELAEGALSDLAVLRAATGCASPLLEQLADEIDQLIASVDWFQESARARLSADPLPVI